MNWRHFQAFLWLRWRITVNQMRKGGTANFVILAILVGGAVLLSFAMFVGLFLAGLFGLDQATPGVLLYLWDGLVAGFLFLWAIGLLVELQRSEILSLEKFLHLPVSLKSAFLINYLSSLVSLSMIIFGPAMVGLSLGLLISKGPMMLLLLPLVLAFFLMATALTHQFQGWLASLMVNKRRRRTIIVMLTMGFVLLSQAPQLLNILQPWRKQGEQYTARILKEHDIEVKMSREIVEAQKARVAGAISPAQHDRRREEISRKYQGLRDEMSRQRKEADEQALQRLEETIVAVNLFVPPGWLPLGARALAKGDVPPAFLGFLGMALIGSASLWRSYRTTLRLYTGQFTSGKKRDRTDAEKKVVVLPEPEIQVGDAQRRLKRARQSAKLLEGKIPWTSEQVSAITMAGIRALTRAPEVKMMLLTPVIMLIAFGSMAMIGAVNPPPMLRPLMAFGAMGTMLLSMVQLIGNQFGFDRAGFRVFVLCAASRRDILLGKNLAFAPLTLGLGTVMVILVEAIYPMRFDYFVAVLTQSISMYLLFCLLANLLSMYAPMPISSGSFKPMNPKGVALLLHLAFMLVFPMLLAVTLLPLGIEFLLESFASVKGWPICLVLSLVECVAVVFLYRLVLPWEGDLLHSREQQILQVVASKAD